MVVMVMVLLGAAVYVGLHSFFLYRRLDLELEHKLLPTYLGPRYIEKDDDDDNDNDDNDDNNGIGCLQTQRNL